MHTLYAILAMFKTF